MGIIKVVALGVVIWLAWFIVKRLCMIKQQRIVKGNSKQESVQSMKQCNYCSIHVLEDEAFSESELYFCNKSHHDKYYSQVSK